MDIDGNASVVNNTAFETIQVAKDWQQHRKMSFPVGGYLGKGLTKYAFQVRVHEVVAFLLNASKFILAAGMPRDRPLCTISVEAHIRNNIREQV